MPDLRGGGAEKVQIDLAREFNRSGHQIEFVLMQKRGELLTKVEEFFTVVDLGENRIRDLLYSLPRYLRHSRPNVFMAAMWPLTVVAPIAQRLSGHNSMVLVSEHNTLSVQYANWGWLHRHAQRVSMAIGYRLADHRVGVSSGVVRDIAALSGLHPEAFDVIYNPVPSRTEPSAEAMYAAEALWSGPKGTRIVTVGSMKAQKNHPLLLRAFARLDRPDARLMFVGDGAERHAVLSLANELGIADQVILVGFQSDPTPFYKTADLFVLSSDYEGFGNVIVEALSCGTPVVSTDCPSGPAEILEKGRHGMLTTPGDPKELSCAIETMLSSTVDREALKRRAAKFSPEIAASQYLELMDR
ncbi:glycosyltransferase [Hoeflea sp. CAU 1731]